MQVTFATEAAPGRLNEDFVAATPDAAVLLDGAGTPPGADSGCSHGVAWYSRTLGSTLLAAMTPDANTLAELLAEGIKTISSLHDGTCDLAHPGSPSATVIMLRRTNEALECLSDGASRLVDRFHLSTWRQVLDTLDESGPDDVIRQVRTAEHSDPQGTRWPRGKAFDDATALYFRL
ncbi:hypothetical protein ABT294_30155 [Nonomuraea sp. NPDC000554]|uniref:hypothetical protein n=1 Tax=Nonomuraea sp. NPDC000554 TaxID=3154259 RepID=UPI00332E2ED9